MSDFGAAGFGWLIVPALEFLSSLIINIVIIAVEAQDVLTFGEDCTPSVQAAIPNVLRMVLEEITPCPAEVSDVSSCSCTG